uniref:Complex 1 LYR protein domain-containing protein n=2 Tax=Oryza meridionalis TaxID=40149 RepID=A0A0E0EMU2_9ORYZ
MGLSTPAQKHPSALDLCNASAPQLDAAAAAIVPSRPRAAVAVAAAAAATGNLPLPSETGAAVTVRFHVGAAQQDSHGPSSLGAWRLKEMPSIQKALPPELADNVIRLYRECLRRARFIGHQKHNTGLLVSMVREQFKKNMHETDTEKIQKMKDDAARGLINHILYESEKMTGRKFSILQATEAFQPFFSSNKKQLVQA